MKGHENLDPVCPQTPDQQVPSGDRGAADDNRGSVKLTLRLVWLVVVRLFEGRR